MKPFVLRALPWLVVPWMGSACDLERKSEPEPASPPGPTVKTSVEKTETISKTESTSKTEKVSRVESVSKTETIGGVTKTETIANTESSEAAAKSETVANTETKTKTETVAPLVPAKAIPARTAVFFREAPKDRFKVWVLPEATAPDPTAARDLGIVADTSGGSIFHGTSEPVLSGDGQWLAFLDDGRLEVMRLDGTSKQRITKHRGSKVEVLIAGFSPDSSMLLFHQGEVQTEEGSPLPKGVVAGFQQLSLADLKLEPKTSLEAFTTFTDDGRHVIFSRGLPDRSTALMRFDLDTGAEEQLQRSTDPFGFSQLVLHDERIVYVHHPAEGRSRVSADALRGSERIDISPEAGFAQLQWPQISLDGQRVSWTDETAIQVRTFDDDTTKTLTTCGVRHCDHAWDSATTVLVLDGGKLSRVSLDGTKTDLANEVKGFTVGGTPG
jgi:hypothetical protein